MHSQNAVSGQNRRIASGIVLAATAGMMACHPGVFAREPAAATGPAGVLVARPATTSEATAAATANATSAAIWYSFGGFADACSTLCPFTSLLSRREPPLQSAVRANRLPRTDERRPEAAV